MNIINLATSKLTSFLLTTSILTGIIIPALPKLAVAAPSLSVPKISFTFDDNLASAYTQAAPTLAKYGYSATDYVITGCLDMVAAPNGCRANTNANYMSTTQLKDLAATYKWEIAAHTDTHPYLATADATDGQANVLTPAQVSNELNVSKTKLSNIGFNATDFASPYGDWLPPVLANIAKTYNSHRGFADSIDQNADGIIDHANLYPYNDYLLYDLQVQAGVTVAQVENFINQAVANKQWLVLTFHDIKPTASTDPADYEYNTADLDAIAKYVKNLGTIQVVNVRDALVTNSGNLLPNSSFDTPLSANIADTTVWSTDAPTFIKQDRGGNGNSPSPVNSINIKSTTKNIELFSPQVPIVPTKLYVVKTYLYSQAITVAAGHETAFYIDEYDVNGAYLQTQFKVAENSVWVESLNFEYTPTSAAVAKARLQIVATANSGLNAYIDNVQWFAEDGSTTTVAGVAKAGDINNDGKIDALDLSIVLTNWNKTGQTRATGDMTGDAKVDALDLSIILSNWGK